MIEIDESALICDFAEVYHILNYKMLPLTQVAILAQGLPDDSRIKRKISGQKIKMDTMLLGAIFDQINAYLYSMTKDSKTGRNRPKSCVHLMMDPEEDRPQNQSFSSGEEFKRAREQALQHLGGET